MGDGGCGRGMLGEMWLGLCSWGGGEERTKWGRGGGTGKLGSEAGADYKQGGGGGGGAQPACSHFV